MTAGPDKFTPLSTKYLGVSSGELETPRGIAELKYQFESNLNLGRSMDFQLHFGHILQMNQVGLLEQEPELKSDLLKTARDPFYPDQTLEWVNGCAEALEDPAFRDQHQDIRLLMREIRDVTKILEMDQQPFFEDDELERMGMERSEAGRIWTNWRRVWPQIEAQFKKYADEEPSVKPSKHGGLGSIWGKAKEAAAKIPVDSATLKKRVEIARTQGLGRVKRLTGEALTKAGTWSGLGELPESQAEPASIGVEVSASERASQQRFISVAARQLEILGATDEKAASEVLLEGLREELGQNSKSWSSEQLSKLPPYILLRLIVEGYLTPGQVANLIEDPDARQKNNLVASEGRLLIELVEEGLINPQDLPGMGVASLREAYRNLRAIVSQYAQARSAREIGPDIPGLPLYLFQERASDLCDDLESANPTEFNFEKIPAIVAMGEGVDPIEREARINQIKEKIREDLYNIQLQANMATNSLEEYEEFLRRQRETS